YPIQLCFSKEIKPRCGEATGSRTNFFAGDCSHGRRVMVGVEGSGKAYFAFERYPVGTGRLVPTSDRRNKRLVETGLDGPAAPRFNLGLIQCHAATDVGGNI